MAVNPVIPKVAIAASGQAVQRVFSISPRTDAAWAHETIGLIAEALFAQQQALEAINARLEQHFVGAQYDHPELRGQ